jgi:U3 small nucleolar RNA-associated protein 3
LFWYVQSGVDISEISRDTKNMTKKQRLEMLASELPELLSLTQDMSSSSERILVELVELRAFLEKSEYGSIPVEGLFMQFLGSKITLHHSYSTNVLFAMFLRAEGKNIRVHPIMKQLLEHQYAMRSMEKMTKYYEKEYQSLHTLMMDSKQQKKMTIGIINGEILNRRRQVKSKSASAASNDGGDSSGEDSDNISINGNDDDDDESSSELGDDSATLMEEDSAFNNIYGEDDTKKKVRTGGKRTADPVDVDFGEFDDRDDILGLSSGTSAKPDLKRALQGFAQAQRSKAAHGLDDQLGALGKQEKKQIKDASSSDDSSQSGDEQSDEDAEPGEGPPREDAVEALRAFLRGTEPSSKRVRRRAPDESMDTGVDNSGDAAEEDGDGAELYEAFVGAKQRYMAKKKLHYTPAPRYGGVEQTVEDGAKRGASYEIMKNKGLTPHRKKANRNPRVKKRQMYAKAVIARKGQVREVVAPASASYGGETTGIKANLSKGRKINT